MIYHNPAIECVDSAECAVQSADFGKKNNTTCLDGGNGAMRSEGAYEVDE